MNMMPRQPGLSFLALSGRLASVAQDLEGYHVSLQGRSYDLSSSSGNLWRMSTVERQ